ncbi:MAG: 6-phospho-beta-glucosidase [Myxococcales bacterium]|nr:MAG: 6-phospho-beta-glucosidase [Myxococcales bacterium]
MKIAIFGGGSTYTPELIEGLIQRHKTIDLAEVALMDVDAERLAVVGRFAERMVEHAKAPFKVTLTGDRQAALRGADFVLTQIRVGQQPARHKDILLGLRHDLIGQETTGVGGFAKALRTIPAMVEIARDMQTLAPDAWMINFTNPSGLVTEAMHRFGVGKLVGLCNIPIGMQMDLALYLQCDPARLKLDYVGLNHLSWVRKVWLDGADVLPRLIDELAREDGPVAIPEMHYGPAFFRALGCIPGPYLRYYYATDKMLADLKAAPKSRAEEVMEIEAKLLAQYADPKVVTKPDELSQRGGAYYSVIAVDLLDAIWNDKGETHIVNAPNRGAVPGLGDDQTVEVPAVIRKDGARPLPTGPVEPKIFGLMAQVKAYETLAAEAGLEGGYSKALMALVAHPLCPPHKAKAVLDDIVQTFGLRLS